MYSDANIAYCNVWYASVQVKYSEYCEVVQ